MNLPLIRRVGNRHRCGGFGMTGRVASGGKSRSLTAFGMTEKEEARRPLALGLAKLVRIPRGMLKAHPKFQEVCMR
jgi:hypothetical protein